MFRHGVFEKVCIGGFFILMMFLYPDRYKWKT